MLADLYCCWQTYIVVDRLTFVVDRLTLLLADLHICWQTYIAVDRLSLLLTALHCSWQTYIAIDTCIVDRLTLMLTNLHCCWQTYIVVDRLTLLLTDLHCSGSPPPVWQWDWRVWRLWQAGDSWREWHSHVTPGKGGHQHWPRVLTHGVCGVNMCMMCSYKLVVFSGKCLASANCCKSFWLPEYSLQPLLIHSICY